MTRLTYNPSYTEKETLHTVSVDVFLTYNPFAKYTKEKNNHVLEVYEHSITPARKNDVAEKTKQHLDQRKCLSVRDLTRKFEKGLSEATKLRNEAKLRDALSLERLVLLTNLRNVLQVLKGCLAGRNRFILEDAISMVETLTLQLKRREGELLKERLEMKQLMDYLKLASEHAKKAVSEERSFSRAEIENARAAVQRVEQALHDQEQISWAVGIQGYEDLLKEAQEARRVKMLHQSSKVACVENELRALRLQLESRSRASLSLQKEIALRKMDGETVSRLYEMDGCESLGSTLLVKECSDESLQLSECSIQWFRPGVRGRQPISSATTPLYAPEPWDVGKILEVDIAVHDHRISLTTVGPIDPAAGLGTYVEALMRKHDNEFNVVIVGKSGGEESVHALHVGKMRMKLCRGRTVVVKEYYSTSMMLCGVRGGGNAAAQSLFWMPKVGLSFALAFESHRERNAAITLARGYALDCNVLLVGPGDQVDV